MKQLRSLMAVFLTVLFVGAATLPAAAATLYYSTDQQLQSYQQMNQWLSSLGFAPYTLVKKSPTPTQPTTQPVPTPTSPAPTVPSVPTTPTVPATNDAALTAQEQQMINLVNQERTSRGLAALSVDMRLVKVARMKSQDMINNNYFGHQSPVYGSPFDLLKAQGITYHAAGENLAGNPSVENAHTGLMNSAGHRANILNTNFTKIGIGIVKGGPYGLMITQEFIG